MRVEQERHDALEVRPNDVGIAQSLPNKEPEVPGMRVLRPARHEPLECAALLVGQQLHLEPEVDDVVDIALVERAPVVAGPIAVDAGFGVLLHGGIIPSFAADYPPRNVRVKSMM